MKYTADYETTTDEKDCRVWGFGLCAIDEGFNTIVGSSIDELFSIVGDENNTLYFHNLKFDGEFILYWLFRNGYRHVADKKLLEPKTFTTLISDGGAWYTMKICHSRKGKNLICTTIIDSLKILPFSIEEIARAFNLPISKLEIDYDEYRAPGHVITEQERDYIINDVRIAAMSLSKLFSEGMTKITQGGNALANYKEIVGKLKFRDMFPILSAELDKDIRQAYRGGWTYLSPRYKNKVVGDVSVFDVNSLYPAQMKYRMLPYGNPIGFEGEYTEISGYPLVVQRIVCEFKLKKNKLPTIQLKHSRDFIATEYLTSSKGQRIALTLTNVDLELFYEHYDVIDPEYIGGYAFKGKVGMFDEYIDKWMEVKKQSTIDENVAMRTLAKLMLNALYGKFGLRIECASNIPVYDEEKDKITYKLGEPEEREPVYIPMACFITAWARYTTITAAQAVYRRFIYADTDSLHLIGHEIPDGLDVDETKLGAWDYEMQADKAKYIRQKTYMERPCGKSGEKYKRKQPEIYELCNGWKVTCAGMPKGCYSQVTPENFCVGSTYKGKLQATRVSGGIVLKDIEFTIH